MPFSITIFNAIGPYSPVSHWHLGGRALSLIVRRVASLDWHAGVRETEHFGLGQGIRLSGGIDRDKTNVHGERRTELIYLMDGNRFGV